VDQPGARFEAARTQAIVLRDCSASFRHHARTTYLRSHRLRGLARDLLLQSVLIRPRRCLAGGSDAPSEALRSFARDVGRELTPSLTTLWNRIEVMLAEVRSDVPPSDLVGDLETLRRHAARMAAIVNGLFCISGEHTFAAQPIDPNGLVEDSLSTAVSQRVRSRIAVALNLDRTIPAVLADSDALRFALTALIEAAAETARTVDVTTRRAGDDEVLISIGNGPDGHGVRSLALQDALRLELADAIVRNLGGRVERRDGNPSTTFVISLRAAGESSTPRGCP
jgi:hypothetical protein